MLLADAVSSKLSGVEWKITFKCLEMSCLWLSEAYEACLKAAQDQIMLVDVDAIMAVTCPQSAPI